MITKIEQLSSFGIFQRYSASADLHEFSRFNLFYGWNGCGKSTLSRLFASLEHKKIDEDFKECKFKIETDAGTLTQQNYTGHRLQIKVFNQDFIKSNIQWDGSVKSILLIAEEKIEDKKKLDELQKDIFKLTNKASSLLEEVERDKKLMNQFFSSSARTIKESFKIIDTSDRYYFNYDKTKFEQFLQRNQKAVKDPSSILTEVQRDQLIKSIQPVEKEEITGDLKKPSIDTYTNARQRINDILERRIIAQVIEHLKDNSALNKWVKEGLDLHQQLESTHCSFCNQPLPQNLLKNLQHHFNDAYNELMTSIEKAQYWIEQMQHLSPELPDALSLYDEFKVPFSTALQTFTQEKKIFIEVLEEWKKQLLQKQQNPFEERALKADDIEVVIKRLCAALDNIEAIIEHHNDRTRNFASDLKNKKGKLELHYAAELIQESESEIWVSQIDNNEKEISQVRNLLTQKNRQARDLEAGLIDEAKGAEQFNQYLHKFLGRTEISLRFNKEAKGYNILRGKSQTIAKNLSEGEKTAIAFVYFVIKLTERGNKIEDTIVVVDDPISSFDSNHLFHSYSFLKSSCEKAKQLFVFTHNFQYFRLIRDWIEKKNKHKEGKIKSRYYSVESIIGEDRVSVLRNAHETLQKYNSEYHYVFYTMHRAQNDLIDNLDKAYLTGNLCRKLLEGFLTFKFPKARNDFRTLLQECCDDEELLERIYRFINKYSHNQLIEFHDTPVDNLMGEGSEIIKDVFGLMKTLDAKHVEEMEEICA